MAPGIALIIITGLLAGALFSRLGLPGLVGMLLVGVLVGPHALDLLDQGMLRVSADFRRIALIVILLRAGFELRRETLNRVGLPALSMSAVPAIFEIAAVTFLAPPLLGLTWLEAAILGSILGAVSPAVVVPLMIEFMEQGKGSEKGIPTLVLAASSLDDVFVIVVFTILLGMQTTGATDVLWQFGQIPVSVVLGILSGLIPGYLLLRLFQRYDLKPPRRTIIVLSAAIGLTWLEESLHKIVPLAGLLGVMAIGFIILEKEEAIAHIISGKLKKLWVFAELLLFVLVGAQVDVSVALRAGLMGSLVIGGGLVARSIGTYLSLWGSGLSPREKLFCVAAYIPKATVQAAIGAAPLAAGVAGGEVILTVAVLSILLTAPTGAVLIKFLGERILEVGQRPAYRFKDLRDSLGLPHVGQRARHLKTGVVWKVIEEAELWQRALGKELHTPTVRLRLWQDTKGAAPGTGLTRWITYTPASKPFDRSYEMIYDLT